MTTPSHTQTLPFAQIFDYDLEDFVKLGIKDLHPDEISAPVLKQIEKHKKKKQSTIILAHGRKKNGDLIICDVSMSNIELDSQKCILLYYTDTTQKSLNEEKIKLQQDLLDKVVQSVIVTNPKGIISFWNKTAEELYGYKREKVIGKKVSEFINVDLPRGEIDKIMSMMQKGEHWSGNFFYPKEEW